VNCGGKQDNQETVKVIGDPPAVGSVHFIELLVASLSSPFFLDCI
jgi:hypothetical protein